jgi:hypothetical protein
MNYPPPEAGCSRTIANLAGSEAGAYRSTDQNLWG